MTVLFTSQRISGAAVYGPMAGGVSGADTTPPTLTGSITVGVVTPTSIAITWPDGADNVAVTSYEVSKNGGASWTNTGSTATTYDFTGLTPSASYSIKVRAKDAAGNVSTPALAVTQATAAGDVSFTADSRLRIGATSLSATGRRIGSSQM